MKFLLNFAAWVLTLLCFICFPGTSLVLSAVTPQDKTEIADFSAVEPVTLMADGIESLVQVQEMLLARIPAVGVNGDSGEVPVSRWKLDEDSTARFEAREAGSYLFTAVLGESAEYETDGILLPLPTVTVMVLPVVKPVQSIYFFDAAEDVVLACGSAEAAEYATLAGAQAALLKKHSEVYVNGGEFSVQIGAWMLAEGTVWDSTQAGKFVFYGELAEPDAYSVESDGWAKLCVRFTKTEKAKIDSFGNFSALSISSANPYGYRTEAEAVKTLTSLYTSVKVNGTNDIVPVLGWSRTGTSAYSTDEGESYTFTAKLGQSEKYDTENLSCALPTLRLTFCAPDSYVSVQLTDENDEPVKMAIVGLYNDEVFHYAFTYFTGKCVFYNVPSGTYTMAMVHGEKECSRTVTVRSGYSSLLTWKISSGEVSYAGGDTEPAETTSAQSKTAAKTAATTTEPSELELLAQRLLNALASGNPSSVTLFSFEKEDMRFSLYPGEMTAQQRASVQSMTVKELAEEIKKAIDALVRMKFSGSTVKARNAVLKASADTDTLILPVHFSRHAQFAFPITVSVDTGEDLGFEKGNCYLYYYNADSGVLEDSGTASSNGKGGFTFTLSHCSDYFLLNIPVGKTTASVQAPMSAGGSAEASLVISQKLAANKTTRKPEPVILRIGERRQDDFPYGSLVPAGGFVLALVLGMILRRRYSMKE